MKVGLELNRERREEEPKDYKEPGLGKYGINTWVNDHFDVRVQENVWLAERTWPKETLEKLEKDGISPVKVNILKRVNNMRAYMEMNVGYGKAKEDPRLSEALASINDLILMAENMAFSTAEDDDAAIITNDYFARCHQIVWHMYDSKNTAINEAFTVSGVMQDRYGPKTREDEMKLDEAARRYKEQHPNG